MIALIRSQIIRFCMSTSFISEDEDNMYKNKDVLK